MALSELQTDGTVLLREQHPPLHTGIVQRFLEVNS